MGNDDGCLVREQSPTKLGWYCCCDANHLVLAERLEAKVKEDFDFHCELFDDMNAISRRAAGGYPVQVKKIECILKILASESSEKEWFIWSDVDVQPLGNRLSRTIEDIVAKVQDESIDLFTQREFDDCGVNLGFLVVRHRASTHKIFQSLVAGMAETKAMDQKVFNTHLLREYYANTEKHNYISSQRIRRLPSIFWASSNVISQHRPELYSLVLHHANFIPSNQHRGSNADARNPKPKMQQLDFLLGVYQNQLDSVWSSFFEELKQDPSLSIYRDRHFPADSIRSQWTELLLKVLD